MDESQHNYAELKKPGKRIDILLLKLYEIPEKKICSDRKRISVYLRTEMEARKEDQKKELVM